MRMNPFKKKCKLKPGIPITDEISKLCLPGDIILSRSNGHLLSSLISEFTNSPYTHAELYIKNGWSIGAEEYGVTYSNHFHSTFIDIFRCTDITNPWLNLVVAYCENQLGQPYEYDLLLGFPWILKLRRLAWAKAKNHSYICSELVSRCFKKIGTDLLPGPESIESPGDIGRSKKLEYLGSFLKGSPAYAVPNKSSNLQKKPSALTRYLVKKILEFIERNQLK